MDQGAQCTKLAKPVCGGAVCRIRICDRKSPAVPVNTESRMKPGYDCFYLI